MLNKHITLHVCPECGTEFLGEKGRVYCSRLCANRVNARALQARHHAKRTYRTCEGCGKSFYETSSRVAEGRGRFCSRACRKTVKGAKPHVCPYCSKEFLRWPTKERQGRAVYCSRRCRARAQTGEKHNHWKGGYAPANQRDRSKEEYFAWRNAVYARDNYTCQHCAVRGCRKTPLNAHHIKTWRDFPDLRYDLTNGITLCLECHRAEHRR